MASAIYEGHVSHRRFVPVDHRYTYRLFMMYLDLSELDQVFDGRRLWSCRRPAPAWFRRSDYLGESTRPLPEKVADSVEELGGRRPRGPIRLLTHLRYFGYCFNPVSFYYCFDPTGERVETVLAEITNTPWKERHRYLVERCEDSLHRRFTKEFHVSPFMDMDYCYQWRFNDPGERLTVHMENLKGDERTFDATLTLARREITGRSLNLALVRHPFMTLKVIGAIHFQALRLYLKRVPFHPRPAKRGAGRSEVVKP